MAGLPKSAARDYVTETRTADGGWLVVIDLPRFARDSGVEPALAPRTYRFTISAEGVIIPQPRTAASSSGYDAPTSSTPLRATAHFEDYLAHLPDPIEDVHEIAMAAVRRHMQTVPLELRGRLAERDVGTYNLGVISQEFRRLALSSPGVATAVRRDLDGRCDDVVLAHLAGDRSADNVILELGSTPDEIIAGLAQRHAPTSPPNPDALKMWSRRDVFAEQLSGPIYWEILAAVATWGSETSVEACANSTLAARLVRWAVQAAHVTGEWTPMLSGIVADPAAAVGILHDHLGLVVEVHEKVPRPEMLDDLDGHLDSLLTGDGQAVLGGNWDDVVASFRPRPDPAQDRYVAWFDATMDRVGRTLPSTPRPRRRVLRRHAIAAALVNMAHEIRGAWRDGRPSWRTASILIGAALGFGGLHFLGFGPPLVLMAAAGAAMVAAVASAVVLGIRAARVGLDPRAISQCVVRLFPKRRDPLLDVYLDEVERFGPVVALRRINAALAKRALSTGPVPNGDPDAAYRVPGSSPYVAERVREVRWLIDGSSEEWSAQIHGATGEVVGLTKGSDTSTTPITLIVRPDSLMYVARLGGEDRMYTLAERSVPRIIVDYHNHPGGLLIADVVSTAPNGGGDVGAAVDAAENHSRMIVVKEMVHNGTVNRMICIRPDGVNPEALHQLSVDRIMRVLKAFPEPPPHSVISPADWKRHVQMMQTALVLRQTPGLVYSCTRPPAPARPRRGAGGPRTAWPTPHPEKSRQRTGFQ